jgi:hypothetical protein
MKNGFKRTTAAIMAALILASAGATTVAMTGVGTSVVSAESVSTTLSTTTPEGDSPAYTAATTGNETTITLNTDITVTTFSGLNLSAANTNVTIDLNKHTLTYTGGTIYVKNGAKLKIENGNFTNENVTYGQTTTSSIGSISLFNIQSKSTVEVDGVTLKTTGTALFPQGDAAEVIVKNSTINAGVYAVGTNAATVDNYGVKISLSNSTFTGQGDKGADNDDCPVMINVEGTLDIDKCTIIGHRQGVLVRAGTATISNSSITTLGTYGTKDKYYTGAWKSGDEVPAAGLVVGSRNGSYFYNAKATVTNTNITAQNDYAAIYMDANTTYSSELEISGTGTISGETVYRAEAEKTYVHKISDTKYKINSTAHTVSVPDATAYAGNTVTLTATADCEGTYQWQVKNSEGEFVDISGETNATYKTDALDAGTYTYKVTGTAADGTASVTDTATVSVYTYTAPADDTTGDNTGDDNNTDDTTTPTPVITTNPDGSFTETSETTTDDGAKLTTAVDKDVDGNVTGSTVTKEEAKDDGSTVTTETKKDADGNVTATTTTTVSDDNSKVVVEESTDTTDKGATIEQTTTTVYNADGEVTGITENHDVAEIGNGTNATVTIAKAGDGTVTDATVEIDKTGATKENGVQATFTKKVMSQVNDILGDAADDAKITMSVKDEKGNDRYSITLNSAELTPNNTLYIYKQDKDGNYVIVNAKEYTTDEKGQLKLTIKSKNDFVMLNEKEANAATKAVLSTVKASKTTASVKKSKTTTMKLDSGLNMANVKSVVYKTSKSSVATVDKKTGKITAKKAGKATVSAVVTLKNGKTKTVKMTVNVK